MEVTACPSIRGIMGLSTAGNSESEGTPAPDPIVNQTGHLDQEVTDKATDEPLASPNTPSSGASQTAPRILPNV